MSLVLDRDGYIYNYDLDSDKLSDVIDCNIKAKKILNLRMLSYVLSTDGHIYKIKYMPTKIKKTTSIDLYITDFTYEYKRNIVYLLSDDNTVHIISQIGHKIIHNHKIIKMAAFEAFPYFAINTNKNMQFSLFMTDHNTIMYHDKKDNFVELNIISELNKNNSVYYVTTHSITENLQFFSDEFLFRHKCTQYRYDPNKSVSVSLITSSIPITKYFRLFNHGNPCNIYVDSKNNKYIHNTIEFKKLPLLINYDVNLPKITNTKNARNVVNV